MLIGQGANDPRVKQAEAEQIVEAIEKNGGKVTYVLYPDEGHGFARPENRIDFNARAEEFLADHLGGRCELIEGDRGTPARRPSSARSARSERMNRMPPASPHDPGSSGHGLQR